MKNYFSDKSTITFLVSLLLASGLWLLIKLSGDFQTEHQVRLDFSGFPIDKVLINHPDSVLTIKTNNNGFDILGQLLFSRNKSLNIDIHKSHLLKTRNEIHSYFILSSELFQEVEEEFKTAEQIIQISPDSIRFDFETLASKKLGVESQIKISFNPRFKAFKEMTIEPDSIMFFGASSILNSISSIKTEYLQLDNVDAGIDTIIKLIIPDPKMIGQQNTIRLKIPVQEYTEGKINLPIQLIGQGNIRYKIFPAEAQVTYQVSLKDYAQVNANDFMLLGIPDPNEAGKLQLRLSRQAETVIVSHIQPAFAEYIILK